MADETRTLVRLGDSELTVANEDDDVRGRTVVDANGDETGKVDGLLIDRSERKVRFLEVGSGGFLGMGKQQVLVPVDAVTRVDEDHVYIDKEREHVASGPGYDPELMPEPDESYLTNVYGYYGYMPHWGTGFVDPNRP